MRVDYRRYLSAKRTVDDRAINENVLTCLDDILKGQDQSRALEIVEIGAGTGSMLARFLRRGMLTKWPRVVYTLVDIKTDLLEEARRCLESIDDGEKKYAGKTAERRARELEAKVNDACGRRDDLVHLEWAFDGRAGSIPRLDLTIGEAHFVVDDALHHLAQSKGKYDVIIAAAFMDLTDLSAILPVIASAARKDGLFYAPINFDGVTDFRPSSSEGAEFDSWVERQFHADMATMFDGAVADQSASGRRLLISVQKNNMQIKSCGGSTWIVYPCANRYSGDEAYFLQCIISFLEDSLLKKTKRNSPMADRIARYVQCRRNQIEAGELYYVAHNIDICALITNPSERITVPT